MMKKIALVLFALGLCWITFSPADSYIRFLFNSATDINSGTLDPARVSPTTFTLQGNAISIATVSAGVNALQASAQSSTANISAAVLFSTSELRSNLNNIVSTNVQTGIFASFTQTAFSTGELRSNLSIILTTNAAQIMAAVAKSTSELRANLDIIVTTNILDGAVTGAKMAAETITHTNMGLPAFTGRNIPGNVILSSHCVVPPSSTTLFIQDEGTLIVAGSTLNFIGAGVSVVAGANGVSSITITGSAVSSTSLYLQDEGTSIGAVSSMNFVGAGVTVTRGENGVSTITIAGGGGGGTTYLSTFTRQIGAGGDVFIGSAIISSHFTVLQDTIIITSAQPYTHTPSTAADTVFSVRRSTEIGATRVADQAIHSSSFTVPANSRYGSIVVPDTITTIFPNETLALWTTVIPTTAATTLPANYGVTIRYFKRP